MIDVEVGGKRYPEMHVDGGVITQLFAYPSHALVELEKATGKPLNRSIRLYVIRNGRLDPEVRNASSNGEHRRTGQGFVSEVLR
jgi:hypothetical protein